jgi:hypothetical protein
MPDKYAVAASSLAAKRLGYSALSELISDEKLGPRAIVLRLRAAAGKHWRADVCRIILVGCIAQRRAEPSTGCGEVEALAGELVVDLRPIHGQAEKFVNNFWPRIEAAARGAAAVA